MLISWRVTALCEGSSIQLSQKAIVNHQISGRPEQLDGQWAEIVGIWYAKPISKMSDSLEKLFDVLAAAQSL